MKIVLFIYDEPRSALVEMEVNQQPVAATPEFPFESVRAALGEQIDRWTSGVEQFDTPVPGLTLYRHDRPTPPMNCMVGPSIALPIQGRKRALLGDDSFEYHPRRFLITSLYLPVVLQAIEASQEQPYLSLVLQLDEQAIAGLVTEARLALPPAEAPTARGMVLGVTTTSLLELFLRLVKLFDEPDAIPVIAPLIKKEVFYRLLTGPQGTQLWQMASAGSQNQRIARSIEWLKAQYAKPLRINDLAARVQMSPSRFHHHFRQLTSMSPLQFQKWLRLNEARRLMLAEHLDAATASFRVGYESASQFSREYSRQFGLPPLRDIAALRKPPN